MYPLGTQIRLPETFSVGLNILFWFLRATFGNTAAFIGTYPITDSS